MNLRRLVDLTFILLVAIGVGIAGAGVAASGDHALAMDSSIEIQPQTVTIEGSTYTFSSIGTTSSDSTFDVSATVPDGTSYSIHLRDSNRNIATTGSRMEGSGEETFDARNLDPGTYMILISADGSYEAAMPLVVKGYDTTLSTPNSIEPGEEVTLQVTTTQTDDDAEPITEVGLVVAHDGEERTITMSQVGDKTYEATVTFEEEGEHAIYAGVRGESEINGEKQFVGLSDKSTINVETDENTDGGGSNDGGSDGGTGDDGSDDGGSGSDAGDSTETPTETETSTATQTATEEPTTTEDTATVTPTETATTPSTEQTDSSTEQSATENGPITPSGTQTPGGASEDEVPLRGVQVIAFALLLAGGYLRGRRH